MVTAGVTGGDRDPAPPCKPAYLTQPRRKALGTLQRLPAHSGRPEQHVITGTHSHLQEEDHCTIIREPVPASPAPWLPGSPAPRQASSVQLFISLPFVNEHNFLSLQYNKLKVNCTKRNAIVKIHDTYYIRGLGCLVVCFSSFFFFS